MTQHLRHICISITLTISLNACDNSTNPPPVAICEDIPSTGGQLGGIIIPSIIYSQGDLSIDKQSFAYIAYQEGGSAHLLDLQEGTQTTLQVRFPENIILAHYITLFWCPYDPDLLAVQAYTYTDTSGNGTDYVLAVNAYIVHRDGNIVKSSYLDYNRIG